MRRVLLPGLFLTLACFACKRNVAPHPDTNDTTKLEVGSDELIESARRSILNSLDIRPTAGMELMFLTTPVSVPKRPGNNTLPDVLLPLYAVPIKEGQNIKLGITPYAFALGQAANDVELGVAELTPSQQMAVDEAKNVLYDPTDAVKPSHIYERYLKYEREHAALVNRLQQVNGAEAVALQNKLKVNDEEWALFGHRADVAKALGLLAVGGDLNMGQLTEWRAVVTASTHPSGNEFWSSIESRDVGSKTTVPFPDTSSTLLGARTRKGNELWKDIKIGGVKRVTLTVAHIHINHQALDHPFVSSRSWRFGKTVAGRVISTGDPTTTIENELVPLVVSWALVIKRAEIVFAKQTDCHVFKTLIDVNDQVEFAGGVFLPNEIESGDDRSPTLIVNHPRIIAVIVRRQPKCPNPDPRLSWPGRDEP